MAQTGFRTSPQKANTPALNQDKPVQSQQPMTSTPKKAEEVAIPSWKEYITNHPFLWTLSSSFSSVVFLVGITFDLFPNDDKDIMIIGTILSLVVNVVISLGLASWSDLWVVEGKTKGSSKTPSFLSRLWRCARFIVFSVSLPSIIGILAIGKYLGKILPTNKNVLFGLVFWGYPCIVCGIISLCFVAYDYFTEKPSTQESPQALN